MADLIPIGSDADLDAINDVLAAIGESRILTLDEANNADVSNAWAVLQRVSRQVQGKSWGFNIDDAAVLEPDRNTKLIRYLPSYLRVFAVDASTTYSNRGGWLYDQSSRTDQFESSLTVTLVQQRPFGEMPDCFRNLIVAKAGRLFNAQFFGSPEAEAMLREMEVEHYQECMEYEMDYGKYNMLDDIDAR